MAVLFISTGRMPFLAPTLDSADPLFALVMPPEFYLHHVEVTDQFSAIGSLQAYIINYKYYRYFRLL